MWGYYFALIIRKILMKLCFIEGSSKMYTTYELSGNCVCRWYPYTGTLKIKSEMSLFVAMQIINNRSSFVPRIPNMYPFQCAVLTPIVNTGIYSLSDLCFPHSMSTALCSSFTNNYIKLTLEMYLLLHCVILYVIYYYRLKSVSLLHNSAF